MAIAMAVITVVAAVTFITHVYETLFLVEEWGDECQRGEHLQRLNVEAELLALKSEVHPHTLFNNLNALSHLVDQGHPRAAAFVAALAESYRYLLKTGAMRLVPLADELALLDQFLSLVMIRYAEGLRVDVHVDARAAPRWQIPPVVLPELLENAVKHNDFTTDNPLEIEIRLEGDRLTVAHDKRPRRATVSSTGLGLENLAQRFRLTTGAAARWAETEGRFVVTLPLVAAQTLQNRSFMRRILSTIGFTVALLCPWPSFAQTPPTSCTTTSQNLWVRDQLNTWYYWYQFMPPGVNPASFNSPDAYLDAVRYRPIDNSFSFVTAAASNDAFYSDSQFIGYGFGNQTTATDIRVLQVYANSPASEAGVRRGDRILTVNGQSVAAMAANGTVGNAFGAADAGVATTIDWETPEGQRRSARMVKRLVTIPTVSLTRVVDVNGRRVGYLFFRNFVAPSMAALTDAFAALKAAGATELVLDLRYNGGGLVDVAVHLASLIGGARTDGQVVLNYVHNDKIGPVRDKTMRFTNPDEALNLQRLVVITTRSSASASELVINSLRPYLPVTVIGDTTYGKPVGQYGLRFCDKVLFPVAFSIKNVNLEGDFFDGIAVDCAAEDGYLHQLGDTAEASFAEALTFIRTGACSARSASAQRAHDAPQVTFRPTGWAAILNAQ